MIRRALCLCGLPPPNPWGQTNQERHIRQIPTQGQSPEDPPSTPQNRRDPRAGSSRVLAQSHFQKHKLFPERPGQGQSVGVTLGLVGSQGRGRQPGPGQTRSGALATADTSVSLSHSLHWGWGPWVRAPQTHSLTPASTQRKRRHRKRWAMTPESSLRALHLQFLWPRLPGSAHKWTERGTRSSFAHNS